MLNVSSTDDLHAQARIRDAAVRLFGTQGIRATTVRQIAEAAGVSPGLVIHHFGSKDGLRRACDDWMMDQLTSIKTTAAGGDDATAAMGRTQGRLAPFIGYFAASIAEGGDIATRMFEAMVGLTRQMYDVGVPAGVMREPSDLDATAALLVAHSLGISVLEGEIAKFLGGERLTDPAVMLRYSIAAAEVYTDGVFADDTMLKQLRAALPTETPADGVTDPDPPSSPEAPPTIPLS